MHRKLNLFASVLILLMMVMAAGTAKAQNIKDRMRERLPVIAALKARGVVGENNRGYLELLKGHSDKQSLISAENADRRIVYARIAQKFGTNADAVGKRRALRIAQKALPGEWLQDHSGKWYQKTR